MTFVAWCLFMGFLRQLSSASRARNALGEEAVAVMLRGIFHPGRGAVRPRVRPDPCVRAAQCVGAVLLLLAHLALQPLRPLPLPPPAARPHRQHPAGDRHRAFDPGGGWGDDLDVAVSAPARLRRSASPSAGSASPRTAPRPLTTDDIHHALDRGVNFLNWAGDEDVFSRTIAGLGRRRDERDRLRPVRARTAADAAEELRSVLSADSTAITWIS